MGVRETVYRGECDGAIIEDEESPACRRVEDVGCAEGDDECSGVVSMASGSASASTWGTAVLMHRMCCAAGARTEHLWNDLIKQVILLALWVAIGSVFVFVSDINSMLMACTFQILNDSCNRHQGHVSVFLKISRFTHSAS